MPEAARENVDGITRDGENRARPVGLGPSFRNRSEVRGRKNGQQPRTFAVFAIAYMRRVLCAGRAPVWRPILGALHQSTVYWITVNINARAIAPAANCRSLTSFGMTIYGSAVVESRPLHKTQGAGHPAATNQSQRPRARAPALHKPWLLSLRPQTW